MQAGRTMLGDIMKRLPPIAFALALAGAASAQTPSWSRPPPSPQQIAAARAEASRIIAKTGHPELFENVTDGAVAKVRHRPSGAVCDFGVDDKAHALVLIPSDATGGEGVSCHLRAVVAFTRGLTVRRMPAAPTLDALFDEGAAAFKVEQSRYGQVKAPDGLVGDMATGPGVTNPGLPPSRTVRYVILGKGGRRFARRQVMLIGDWAVMSDFTSTAGEPLAGEMLGGLLAVDDFKAVAEAQKAAPGS